jgi:hypothetical protein
MELSVFNLHCILQGLRGVSAKVWTWPRDCALSRAFSDSLQIEVLCIRSGQRIAVENQEDDKKPASTLDLVPVMQ